MHHFIKAVTHRRLLMQQFKSISLALFAVSLLVSTNQSYGQNMNGGMVVSTYDCRLAEGRTMEEAISWARQEKRGEWAPNNIFYRQPLVPPYQYEYDFTIVRYYSSWSDYVSKSEMVYKMSLDSAAPRERSNIERSKFMNCDPKSRKILRVRGVPGGDTPSDETLMTARFCRLDEGKTMADAWNRVNHIAENWRSQGDNTAMQLVHRAMGPGNSNTTTQGRQYVINEIGETPESTASRWDKGWEGFDARTGSEPVSQCNYPTLWRTHRVFQR
jgi:hypothetical protein